MIWQFGQVFIAFVVGKQLVARVVVPVTFRLDILQPFEIRVNNTTSFRAL
jgi:hypothetical protein